MKIAPDFQYFFLFGTADRFTDPIASGELSSATQTLFASDPRLTNIAGASFGSAGAASITRYSFNSVWTGAKREDSFEEARIKASTAYVGFKIRQTNRAVRMARASTNHPVGAVRPYTFSCDEGIAFGDPPGDGLVDKALNNPINLDLFLSLGKAHIAGNVTVYLKNINGTFFTRTSFSFIGGVGDLYDFTPLSVGRTRNSSVVQSGYRAGSPLRSFGKIYTSHIAIND